jgi:hypothetical protein
MGMVLLYPAHTYTLPSLVEGVDKWSSGSMEPIFLKYQKQHFTDSKKSEKNT